MRTACEPGHGPADSKTRPRSASLTPTAWLKEHLFPRNLLGPRPHNPRNHKFPSGCRCRGVQQTIHLLSVVVLLIPTFLASQTSTAKTTSTESAEEILSAAERAMGDASDLAGVHTVSAMASCSGPKADF